MTTLLRDSAVATLSTRLRPGPCSVMRHPCVMEDEGRHELILSGVSREDAEAWIASQVGYFKVTDYYVVEAPKR